MGYLYLRSEQFPADNDLDVHIKSREKNSALLKPHYKKAIRILESILKKNKTEYTSLINYFKSNEIQSKINAELKKIDKSVQKTA